MKQLLSFCRPQVPNVIDFLPHWNYLKKSNEKKISEILIFEILKYESELHSNINRCFDERSKWKNCLHSLINEMTLVYHYDDNGCDVSANGQKQTNKYARSIILLNHKTQIIKAHENKQNLAY